MNGLGWEVGEVTLFRGYLLHTIKSDSIYAEKVPHVAHLGHLRHPIAASGRNVAQRAEARAPEDRHMPCYSCSRNLRTRSMRGRAS